MKPAVTPRFAGSCSAAMLRGAGELARRTGWFVQTHLAETDRECRTVSDLHGGASCVDVYERAGLLTARTLLGRGLHLSDADRDTLACRTSTIAHCPAADRFLDAGVMDLHRHALRHVSVCLGSGVGAGPDRSMVRVARAMLDAAKQAAAASGRPRHELPMSSECWWRITAGNARSLGLVDPGMVAPGCAADLLVVRPTKPWRDSIDPLAMLLYAWDDRWIASVRSNGRERFNRR